MYSLCLYCRSTAGLVNHLRRLTSRLRSAGTSHVKAAKDFRPFFERSKSRGFISRCLLSTVISVLRWSCTLIRRVMCDRCFMLQSHALHIIHTCVPILAGLTFMPDSCFCGVQSKRASRSTPSVRVMLVLYVLVR